MNDLWKKIIAIGLATALLGIVYYGSFLPMRKSQAFIATLRNTGGARTLDQFLGMFAEVFAMPSPIGQEELVRNFAGTAIGLLNNNLPPAAVSIVVQFTEDSFKPIMERGRGMSYTQNLYTLGNLNQAAFLKTRDARYLDRARQHYEDGLKRAPQRPQFLYGLFDVYRLMGNPAGVKEIGDTIVSLWNDERIIKSMEEFFVAFAAAQRQASSTPTTP